MFGEKVAVRFSGVVNCKYDLIMHLKESEYVYNVSHQLILQNTWCHSNDGLQIAFAR